MDYATIKAINTPEKSCVAGFLLPCCGSCRRIVVELKGKICLAGDVKLKIKIADYVLPEIRNIKT
jgi:hypothetical protein